MTEPVHPAQLLFSDKHPLTAFFGMKFEVPGKNELHVHVDAPESFTDETGIYVHSGFNIVLLDTVMGSCAIGELKKIAPIATIKLSCDHIAKAKPGEKLICKAFYDGEENEVVYIRGEVHSIEQRKIISHAVGTFMVGTATQSIREKT